MLEKIVLLSDTHIGVSSDDDLFLSQAVDLFKTVIEHCKQENINKIFFLGDFFDNRKNIGLKAINTALEIATLLDNSGIHTFMVIGNHDTYHKLDTTINSINMFKMFKNITIVDTSLEYDDYCLVSWRNEIKTTCPYLFGHFEINGFPVTKNQISSNMPNNISDFNRFKGVISGHYHLPSKINNITYIGSPYHLTFNDVGSVHGFYEIYDGHLTFIPYKCIEFVNVYDIDIDKSKINGNIIRLIFTKDHGTVQNQKILDEVSSYNPMRMFIHYDVKNTNDGITVVDKTEIKSKYENLFDFIKLFDIPENLNVKLLNRIIKELIGD